ncbi:hypothetical protein Aph01nite_00240 [Acrocarpospora phusangensis]|uniref:Luciferase-like domain-containing protein n=1 Tax=Acrocarpospora phusangensis TaxID=1070424 RepID=A0A919Q5P9_9ACTN|nr:LLM class flavin-dependent oxidoreductase [Acrocarpospora phusangensis]GIH21714.1 hypothetical protein Aph01nite_00240 [Acrocarpospora phusangensis]
MTYSLRVNNDLDIETLVDLARRAERYGFDQLWVSNDLFLRSAPVLLGILAAKTERIKLGVGIMNPYSVHVSEIAMMAATMQEATGGRFLLGVAAGSAEFLAWAGIERPRPLARTAEAVTVLRALLGSAEVRDEVRCEVRGEAREELPAWFGPLSQLRLPPGEPVPVYVGAMSPKMLQLAGRLADGVLPLLYPPEHFTTARAEVLRGAEKAGRSPAELDIPACFWVSAGDDEEQARLAMAAKIAYYGPSFAPYLLSRAGLAIEDFAPITAVLERDGLDAAARLVDDRMLSLGITGSVAQVVERCRSLRAAGAEHLSFGPPLGPDPREAVELLGSEVLPALTATKPTATKPAVIRLTAIEPPATEPPVIEVTATEPTATEPTATKPAVIRLTAIEPPATEPTATEPAAIELAATEPAAIELTATEPAAIELAATEPAVVEPAVGDNPGGHA